MPNPILVTGVSMKTSRIIALAALIVGCGLGLYAQRSPDAPQRETVTVVADVPIPRSAFIYAYVISGEVRSQVDDEPARVYQAGETWFENPVVARPCSVPLTGYSPFAAHSTENAAANAWSSRTNSSSLEADWRLRLAASSTAFPRGWCWASAYSTRERPASGR